VPLIDVDVVPLSVYDELAAVFRIAPTADQLAVDLEVMA
jgi:hypothetical protein